MINGFSNEKILEIYNNVGNRVYLTSRVIGCSETELEKQIEKIQRKADSISIDIYDLCLAYEMNITKVAKFMNMTRPTIYKHLKTLSDKIKVEREKKISDILIGEVCGAKETTGYYFSNYIFDNPEVTRNELCEKYGLSLPLLYCVLKGSLILPKWGRMNKYYEYDHWMMLHDDEFTIAHKNSAP